MSLGGAEGILGSPRSSEVQFTKDGKGRFKDFQDGTIYWFPTTGVHEVHGAILTKWNALERETGWLGYPVSDEIQDAIGNRKHSDFQHGSIYWSEQTGAMALRAPILALWKDLGGETGKLGYPTSDEKPGTYPKSRYHRFQNGSSIYWDEERGAYEVFPLPEPTEQPSGAAGVWQRDLHDSKVVGIHAALLHTGRVLFFSHGNPRVSSSGEPTVEVGSAVLEASTGEVSQQQLDNGVICSGHTFLADGRLLACGSERRREGVHAIRVFTPAGTGGDWRHVGELEEARWYPTCTRLHDGRILIVGGHKWFRDGNEVNTTFEVFDPNQPTRDRRSIPFLEHNSSGLFPVVFVLPSGKLLVHAGTETSFLDLHDFSFDTTTLQAADRPDRNSRTYDVQGTAVVLPLVPDSTPAYRARVMLIGGGGPQVTARTMATKSCEILDLGESPPAWKLAEPMANERVMPDSVLLPDGTVLVTNGSFTGKADCGANPVLAAELYDPVSEKWTTLNPMKIPRLYHSVALLLPDGRVLTAGTDSVWHQARYNKAKLWVETFSPPYLDRGPRPIIQNAPGEISYNTKFEINAALAQGIKSVALISPGSVTHSFNSSQRYVGLSIIQSSVSSLSVMSPPDPFVAPPGYYMLFIVNEDGVPCISRFIKLEQQ